MEKLMLVLLCIFSIQIEQGSCKEVDYWSNDFDPSKDCESQDLIDTLLRKEPSQCEDVPKKQYGDQKAFGLCKTRLTIRLQKICDFSSVEKAGDLIYCQLRGIIRCCFVKHKCVIWKEQENFNFKLAKRYLKDKHGFVKSLVKSSGYKTCHPLKSLDTSKCAKDCEKLAEEKFAQNCTSNGGLFKCCIRRQTVECHECRYCCTLPMCTQPPGDISSTVFDGLPDLELDNQKNKFRANDIFFSTEMLYKNDYRCLKPDSHKNPKKWQTYEIEAYRKAFSPEMLESVQTFAYNNYAYNFADPKVVRAFTKNDKNARKYWRKAHGIYYATTIPGVKGTKGYDWFMNLTACTTKCIEMESSKFAKSCHKKGGYFKCCVADSLIGRFVEIRPMLIEAGLIKAKPENPCREDGLKNPCHFCLVDGICTLKDPFTGQLSNMFYPYTKTIRKISDKQKSEWDGPGFGLRFQFCIALDICKYGTSRDNILYYDKTEYQEATNKKEVCTAKLTDLKENKALVGEEKKKRDEQLCSKLTTNNIYLCSDQDKKDVTDQNIIETNIFLERKIKNTKVRSKTKKTKKAFRSKKSKKSKKRKKSKKAKGKKRNKAKQKSKKNKKSKKSKKSKKRKRQKTKY